MVKFELMKINSTSEKLEKIHTDAVAVILFEGEKPSGKIADLDKALSNAISETIRLGEFKGRLYETTSIFTHKKIPSTRVLLVGGGNNVLYSKKKLQLSPNYKALAGELQGFRKKIFPRHGLDQAPLSPSSALAKIAYAMKRGDVTRKRVACIGDDDFLSLILALTGKAKDVLSIDLDKRVLRAIKGFSKKSKIKMETLKHDLRKPIPKRFRNKYDTVFFWSSDTEIGFNLFASRGIELLREKGKIYASVTPSWCHPLELLGIRKGIFAMKLRITDFARNSGEYIFANKIWKVDLIRMEKSSASNPIYRIFRGKIPY